MFHFCCYSLCLLCFIVANVFIGLFLFGDKIANPQDMNAYWVFVALVSAFGLLDGAMSIYFGFSRYYCPEKTQPKKEVDQSETEMKKIDGSLSDSSSPPPPSKKTPSPVRSFLEKNLWTLLSTYPFTDRLTYLPTTTHANTHHASQCI